MKPTILITGIAGLLGARLADWLCQTQSYDVVGVDNLSGGYRDNIHPSVIFYEQDICDGMYAIFAKHKPHYVFHFAAYAAEGLSPFIRKFNYQNNVIATAEIINQCINHPVKRLVFASSMAVYGKHQAPFDERLTPQPIDPYGIAKFACEMDIMVAGTQHDLDWCIIRPHNVYGAKQNIWDKYRNVLGIWMHQHLNGQALTIYGDGEQKRAFSAIEDCIEPMHKAAIADKASREVINLGGITECSINQAADAIIAVMGGGDKHYLEARHEVKFAYPTHQKSIDILGYHESATFHERLSTMWAWAKIQPERTQKLWSGFEVNQGIYSYWQHADSPEVLRST